MSCDVYGGKPVVLCMRNLSSFSFNGRRLGEGGMANVVKCEKTHFLKGCFNNIEIILFACSTQRQDSFGNNFFNLILLKTDRNRSFFFCLFCSPNIHAITSLYQRTSYAHGAGPNETR